MATRHGLAVGLAVEPFWRDDLHKGRLGLAGGSEGSMVAAMLAPLVPETRAVLLFSSGGGSDFGAEVKASMAY